jgi:nitric oxide dioxygenase
MTPMQIDLVRASWMRVSPIRAAAADLFYARLFELAPEVRPMFKRDIHAQGAMLMAAIHAVVNSLDRMAEMMPAVEQMARRHVQYGVQERHYDVVGTALIWTLEQGLGADFTPAMREAWMAAYGALAGAMKRAAYAQPMAEEAMVSPA